MYVYKFVERYLLKTLIQKENHLLEETNGISFLLNDKKYNPTESNINILMQLINNFNSFKLSKQYDSFLIQIADESLNKLELQFDIKYELITGMDKKELDDFVYAELSCDSGTKLNSDPISIPAVKQLINLENNLYADKADQLVDGISNSRYFIMEDDDPNILFEKNYPGQSITNLFHEPLLANNSPHINVNQKLYGGRTVNYTTSLGNFSKYFKESCELYTGVESINGDSIKAVLVYYESDLKLLHLAEVELNYVDLLNHNSIGIDCRLYANIRTDNISNIFKEYRSKQDKINIKLN